MFNFILAFRRVKASFLLPFSPRGLCDECTLNPSPGAAVTLSRPAGSIVYFFRHSSLRVCSSTCTRAPRARKTPGPPHASRAGGQAGGGRDSGQGQPRGCLVSASREGAAMRSLVRRHRGFTWPLRRTVEAPRPLQSILCDCPRGRRSCDGRTRACLQQLWGEHRQELLGRPYP